MTIPMLQVLIIYNIFNIFCFFFLMFVEGLSNVRHQNVKIYKPHTHLYDHFVSICIGLSRNIKKPDRHPLHKLGLSVHFENSKELLIFLSKLLTFWRDNFHNAFFFQLCEKLWN